jgi:hypothetical protein
MPGFVAVAMCLIVALGAANLVFSTRAASYHWRHADVTGVPPMMVFLFLLLPALLAAGGVLFGGTLALITRRSSGIGWMTACVLATLANAVSAVLYFVSAGHALDALS